MEVICFCTYLTSVELPWRPHDHDAHKFIDAIKDRDINGYAYVKVGDKWPRFDNSNRQEVVGWFAKIVASHIQSAGLEENVALVPVPGSKCDVKFAGQPRTAILASAIANELHGVTLSDVLRWKTPMPSANEQGGTRDPKVLLKTLVLTGPINGPNVVLVDDVLTSGGHLQASAALLRQNGVKVLRAICAGRADGMQPADPFGVRVEEIPDFEP